MIPMLKTSWWTYDESLKICKELYQYAKIPDEPNSNQNDENWFTDTINELDMELNVVGIDVPSNLEDIIDTLMTIVYDRHAYDYIYEKTLNWNANVVLNEVDIRKIFSKLINVINLTAPRYIPLLKANKDASSDVIKPMKSETTSTNRFNDTPQNGGFYAEDSHTTNASESTSTTTADSGSLAQRLDEAFKNYKSIILEWSNEFNQLFIKEEQL